MAKSRSEEKKDGLVAILKDKYDLTILQEQGWYRIPVKSVPKRWPPNWIAFYQPKVFGPDAYQIRFYGKVKEIRRARRKDLFPSETITSLSEKEYFVLHLSKLEELEISIPSHRPRRLVFIPTTWSKFQQAEQINDLFDDSPLEDKMWNELKQLSISAERQWVTRLTEYLFYLDFAIFCNRGRIDIETDGDTWHTNRKRVPLDNARDNALQIDGWKVLRYNTTQIGERFNTECMRGIEASINQLGGLSSDGIVPREFYTKGDHSVQQLSIFDKSEFSYFVEPSIDIDELE